MLQLFLLGWAYPSYNANGTLNPQLNKTDANVLQNHTSSFWSNADRNETKSFHTVRVYNRHEQDETNFAFLPFSKYFTVKPFQKSSSFLVAFFFVFLWNTICLDSSRLVFKNMSRLECVWTHYREYIIFSCMSYHGLL